MKEPKIMLIIKNCSLHLAKEIQQLINEESKKEKRQS